MSGHIVQAPGVPPVRVQVEDDGRVLWLSSWDYTIELVAAGVLRRGPVFPALYGHQDLYLIGSTS